ncbi:MAG: iron ABC transporter permease [Phycisphaerales bacterium]|nr:iron ABC transporter permease [Phycisphaerales bacterium]
MIATLALTPLVYLIIRALGESEAARVGSFLSSGRTLEHAGRSIGLAAVVTCSSTVLAFLLALCTGAIDLPFRRTCTILSVCPLAIPCYVGATVYIGAFSPEGMLGGITTGLGLRSGWFSGFWASAFILTIFTYPLAYLPIRAGMASADRSLIEASRLLGRSNARAWMSGMLAQVRSSITAGALMVALYTLSEFGAVSMLRCDTFTRVIYLEYESAFDRTGAALSSLALVLLIGFVLVIGERFRGRNGSGKTGRSRRPALWRLGRWRWPGLIAILLLTGITLVLPVTSLFAWWGRAGETLALADALVSPLLTSLSLATIAGVVSVLFALPVGVLVARHHSPLATIIERITHVGFGLPGIVVGLALVFTSLRLLPIAYQSWSIVIAGYVILFLAQATGPIRTGLDQTPRPIEDAARTLGANWARRFRTVTLPLLAPGMTSAFLLVFISSSKELPSTLLLAPAGTHTLATRVWQYTEEAMYAESAPPALTLIALSACLVATLVWREGLLEKAR